jgi:N-acetylglucosamine kinase-like BadF-type ATPase
MKKDNQKIFEVISENIQKLVQQKNTQNLSWTKFMEEKGILKSQGSLIKSGKDFRISTFIDLLNKIGIEPNEVLEGLFSKSQLKTTDNNTPSVNILFISEDVKTNVYIYLEHILEIVTLDGLGFKASMGASVCLKQINDFIAKHLENIDPKNANICVIGQQYEFESMRKTIEVYCVNQFKGFKYVADWEGNYIRYLNNLSGVCVTINDGLSLSYKEKNSHKIQKTQGWGFPLSDDGGDIWIGWEGAKAAIREIEINNKDRSLLAQEVLAKHQNLSRLSEDTFKDRFRVFKGIANIVKTLKKDDDIAQKIINNGYQNIKKNIEIILDNNNVDRNLYFIGNICYLYRDMFDNDNYNIIPITTNEKSVANIEQVYFRK